MVQCNNSNYIMLWNGWQINVDSDAVPYWINKDFINKLGNGRAYISYRPKLIYEEN